MLALCALTCAQRLPEAGAPRALVRDIERVVDVRGSVGWLVDESELTVLVPDAMKSACQVTAEDRVAALVFLDGRVADLGGDAANVWRARDKDLDNIKELLLATRGRLLLRRADEWARAGRCPFWLEPSLAFGGVHTQGGRFVLSVEGGGRLTEEFALGRVRYGAGGSGRLMGGYGVSETWVLAAGLEFGGLARFTNLQLGTQSELPQLVGFAAAPVVARWLFGRSAHGEIEAGPMAYIDSGSADPNTGRVSGHFDPGIHGGVALGGTYLRLQRGVIPKFSVALTVDYVPGAAGRPAVTQVGIGARTGIDLSSWTSF